MSCFLKMTRYKVLQQCKHLCESLEDGVSPNIDVAFQFFDMNSASVKRNMKSSMPHDSLGSMQVRSANSFSVMLDSRSFGMGTRWQGPFMSVSDQDFVKAVMAECHELHHVKQYLASRNQFSYDAFSPDVTVSSIVGHQNPYYYGLAYKSLLHELDANAQGFLDGYAFLVENFSDKFPNGQSGVDALVLECMCGRFGCLYGVDSVACDSVEHVAQSLFDSYSRWSEEAVQRRYDSTKTKVDNRDEGYAVTHGLSGVPPMCVRQWREVWDAFSYSRNTRDASYRLCAITLRLHPEYLEEFSCLKAVQDDFALDKLFPKVLGNKFLEPVNDTLERISECCPRSRFPGGVGRNGFSGPPEVFDAKDVPVVQSAPKPDRSVPEAVDIPPSRTPDYESVERPAVRPQSCSGRSLRGLDVDPDNSNNVSNDFERS